MLDSCSLFWTFNEWEFFVPKQSAGYKTEFKKSVIAAPDE